MFHTTKYGCRDLLGMSTKVSTVKGTTKGRVQTVEALADSGASASIISWWCLERLMHMDVSGKGEIMVQEEHGLPHKIKVLVLIDLGQDELVVGLENLKRVSKNTARMEERGYTAGQCPIQQH